MAVAGDPFEGLSRRDVLAAAGLGAAMRTLKDLAGPVIERAHATDPAGTGVRWATSSTSCC